MKSFTTDVRCGALSDRPSSSGISRDDWLKALSEAGLVDADDPDAVTASEFAEMFGTTHQSARRVLKALVAQGAAMLSKRKVPGRAVVTAYRLIHQPAKKGRKH